MNIIMFNVFICSVIDTYQVLFIVGVVSSDLSSSGTRTELWRALMHPIWHDVKLKDMLEGGGACTCCYACSSVYLVR